MSFKFSARAILELGKELISSDEVAIFELIKNAVDAQSKRVEVAANIQLLSSNLKEIVLSIEEKDKKTSEVLDDVRRFLIDSDAMNSVELLDELDKVECREVFLEKLRTNYNRMNYIEVRDSGHGMSLADLSNIFLRIGTNSRRKENLEGARNLGDKGIGRLSAMRLGDHLHVRTSRSGERCWNLLNINWGDFSHNEDIDVDAISIEPEIGEEKVDSEEQGTTIRISALQSNWDDIRFENMFRSRIARMIDPFEPGLANRLIIARHNGKRISIPSVPPSLLQAAHAVCHVEFRMEGGEPILSGEIDYRHRHRKLQIDVRGPDIYSLTQKSTKRRAKRGHAAYKLSRLHPSALRQLGAFKCDIYWYNRRIIEAIEGLTINMAETRDEVSNWSGGPMLYRYGYRILPYGDPGDDWLSLDEEAFGQKGFKFNRQQLIGRVLLDTAHTDLSEQTNREGLIDSDTVDALTRIMLWVVHTQMRELINEADDIELSNRRAAEQDTTEISKARARVVKALQHLHERVGEQFSKQINDLSGRVERLSTLSQDLVDRIEAVIEEADQEREKFVYLAGVGLMTEFIFHELERAVSHTINVIQSATQKRTTLESLNDQLKTLHKRIAAFDELTGEKRQRKVHFDFSTLVWNILEDHKREFERHNIRICFEQSKNSLMINAVRGMVIQILENLINNAAYWLKQQKKYEPEFEPRLTVTLDTEEKTFTLEDNGPGVTEDNRDRIFQPYITTKPTGQGRGLGLYIARNMAEYHGWGLSMDQTMGRIRKGRTNMFVLKMG